MYLTCNVNDMNMQVMDIVHWILVSLVTNYWMVNVAVGFNTNYV